MLILKGYIYILLSAVIVVTLWFCLPSLKSHMFYKTCIEALICSWAILGLALVMFKLFPQLW